MLTFLFFRAGKKAVYLLLFLFILGIVVRIGSWFGQVLPFQDTDVFWVEWYKWIYYPFQTRLDGLLVGVSLAGLFQFYPGVRDRITRQGDVIYLSHKGVIHLSQQLFMKWGIAGESNLMFFLCIVMTLLGALVLRYTIEKPFLKARDYILQKRRAGREQLPVRMRA